MKFRYFEEEFTSPENRDAHYTKHVVKNKEFDMTPEQYEQEAEKLAKTPVDNKNIFGYIQQRDGNTAYCKYNKEKEFFTVYTYKKGVPYTITFFNKSWREYNGDKAMDYYDEIPDKK